jgi:hypothetical protein
VGMRMASMESPPFLILRRHLSSEKRSDDARFRSNGRVGKECLTDRGETMTRRLRVGDGGEHE